MVQFRFGYLIICLNVAMKVKPLSYYLFNQG